MESLSSPIREPLPGAVLLIFHSLLDAVSSDRLFEPMTDIGLRQFLMS